MKFSYYMPTRIVSGKNCVKENAGLISPLGKKAFIMSGKSSAKKIGALADMTAALESQGIAWEYYNKVKPNPSLEDVREAAGAAVRAEADFVVAIGGGSPMDAAKAVAVLAADEVSDDELLGQRFFSKVLPLVAVPTTAGTGSEVTPYSILTNNKLQTKSFLNSEQVYPAVAFLDGKYTEDLPFPITAATVIDALSHSAEGYLAVRAIPPAQALALESLTIIGSILPKMASGETPCSEDREALLYASTLAGIVISQSGTTAVHAMGYSLTYFKGLDHGVANGYLLGEYFKYIAASRPLEVKKILSAMGFESIDALSRLIDSLLDHFELTKEEADKFASIAIKAGNIANTDPCPSEEELQNILCNSLVK
ncbi:MAG: iron-containing alcohol dehydrogenase family protein [Spirochaetales bacterium]|nr:iron-containing alcohol dehydrogenase family protein [Spirochaetales bacterium]